MISRRSVLKSFVATAAAIMAPAVKLRPAVPDERLMLAFCEDEPGFRWKLDKPFGVGSLTYATDRFAMVRAEIANRQQEGEVKLPPVSKVWTQYWEPSGRWQPVTPELIRPTLNVNGVECPDCGGRRISLGDQYPGINDYPGPGYDPDDNSVYDSSCKTCYGHAMDCPRNQVCVVDGVPHSAWLMRRIMSLPNARVCSSRFDDLTILFTADGFEGISKGVHVDHKERT